MVKQSQRKLLISYAKKLKAKKYQTNPIQWQIEKFKEPVTNWYWSKWPGYENHKWDGTKDPFAVAIKALAQKKWVGIESATSTGKTFILPRIIMWFLDVFDNSLVITTAPRDVQLKEVLWKEIGDAFGKFNRIRTYAQLNVLRLNVDNRKKHDIENISVGHKAIGVVSGVAAGEESATKMQGFHNVNMLFVIDETTGVHPAIMKAIQNTSTASNNLVIAIGNPDSQLDPLHLFCTMKRVQHIVISAYDHPNIVLNEEVIPGAVSVNSIDFRKEEYGEENSFYKSRVRGIAPSEGVNSLIKAKDVDRCNIHDKKHFIKKKKYKQKSVNAIGVDVANSLDGDKGCVAYGKKHTLKHIQEFSCPNANFLAYNLMFEDYKVQAMGDKGSFRYNVVYDIPKISEFNVKDCNIGIDTVGVGVGTMNAFLDYKREPVGLLGGPYKEAIKVDDEDKPLYNFNSLRSQMYFQLMLDLQAGEIILDIDDPQVFRSLKKELTTPTYKVTGGSIKVEEKEAIKDRLGGKSPNYADACVYWNWMRHGWYAYEFYVG